MTKPMFVTCCSRAVGCQDCVQRWFQERGCCPHCSTIHAVWIELNGVEDLLSYTRQLCGDDEVGTDSDSDFRINPRSREKEERRREAHHRFNCEFHLSVPSGLRSTPHAHAPTYSPFT